MKRITFWALMLISWYAKAQNLDSLLNINAFTAESDLQKQLNKATTVASGKALTTRETPGILSTITSEEIENSGARDLTDILRLIPGFDFAHDINFVTGVAMRGNWAHEGKVLILLNGFQMNEILYQNTVLINHFPVDFIERIEIIRGPGSAIYGGSAEYGVINIITKSTESLNGVAVVGTGGFHGDAIGRLNAGIMAAQKNEVYSWDLSAYKGKGILSNRPYQDLYEDYDVQDLAKETKADPLNLNLGVKYRGLSVRWMYDKFELSDPVSVTSFLQNYVTAKYDWKVSDKLTLVPQLTFTNQIPWDLTYTETDEFFRIKTKRTMANIYANYDLNRKVNFNFGALYFHDKAEDLLNQQYFDGSDFINLNNYALFVQGLLKHRLANVTAGFRYEKNSRTDGTFVPRLALTKKIENFHFKALYSKAFRTPSIENVNIAKDGKIKPEKATAMEFELGYQFTPEMLLAVNGFYLSTSDPIVYYYEDLDDENFIDYYENYEKTGTKGIEAVYAIRTKNWYTTISYSFSRALSDNTVETYSVPQTNKQYVGMLAHKFTANSSFTITKGLSFNPSVIVGGKRYAYQSLDSEGTPEVTELPSYTLVNLFLNYRNVFPLFSIGAGIYDLFNEHPAVPQAYNGDYAPLSGREREYVVKISYQLNFTKP